MELGYIIEGIYDDSYDPSVAENIAGAKLKGRVEDCFLKQNALLAMGNPKKREQYFSQGFQLLDNIVHQAANVSTKASLGKANQVLPQVFINSFTEIGDNNLINSGAIIEHECQIGNHNHISVGAKICGRVSIGNCNMIGAGAIVIDGIRIASNIIVGAGAVVVSDLLESGTYVGNPAKKIK
jgi:sugar O-acyltransferase (sialic acid O-acetyltransferase NeuD family)